MVFGSKGFTRGTHYWEVYVDNTPHYNKETLFIGVATAGATSWKGYGFTNHRVLRTFDNSRLYGHNFTSGDTIGVLLDADHGTLSFIKYGADDSDLDAGRMVIHMGVANRYLNRGNSKYTIPCFYPCIGARFSTERLCIRKYYSLSQKGCNTQRLLSQAVYGKALITHWHDSYRSPVGLAFPMEFMRKVYARYRSWLGRNTLLVRSRPGLEVVLDVDACCFDALAPRISIPLRYGMKFTEKVMYFNPIKGSVVGVSGGNRVWFTTESLKDNVGAWYWHVEDLEALIATGILQFEDADSHAINQRLYLNEAVQAELEVPVEKFLEIFSQQQSIGTLELDAEITRVATAIGNTLSIDPSCVPARYLFNEFRAKGLPPTHACMRYTFLVAMNVVAGAVLPYTDFGVTDERHLQVSTDLCKANCHFEPLLKSAQHFHSLKSVIFLKTKMSYWNAVIRETVTPTEAVQEIFDVPKDIQRDEIKGDLLTHSWTYSLTHSLTHLLTHLLTHSLTH
jgi:hypothetical protein